MNEKPVLIETTQDIPEGYSAISNKDATVVKEILSGLEQIHDMIQQQYKDSGFENK